MSQLHFHFIDDARGEDARLAAAILSDCMSRQGYANEANDGSISVTTTIRRDTDPDEIYIVHNERLLARPDLLDHLYGRSVVVICSARPPRVLRSELGQFAGDVTTVDASGIASDEGADPVVAMLGAAARAVPFIDHDAISASVWNFFDRDLPYAAQAAIRAFDLGYMQAQSSH